MRPLARPAALGAALIWVLPAAAPAPARADERDERIEALERRVEDLEARLEAALGGRPAAPDRPAGDDEEQPPQGAAAFSDLYAALDVLPEWIARVRLGGSADVGYFDGERDSVLDPTSFAVWDARLFVDSRLGEEVLLADHLVLREAAFSFEWDLVRLGELENRVGDLYVDLRGIGGSSWANAQVGRFQIPVGESYLRYGKGFSQRPFITNDFGPWFWDEGIRLSGSDFEGRYGYVASASDGDNSFDSEGDSDKQVTLKLFARPRPWLQLSVSGARTGRLGSNRSPSGSALWLGESWARAFGSSSGVPNFIDGMAVPDGPNVLRDAYLAGADVIVERTGARALLPGPARHGPGQLRLRAGLPARLPLRRDARLQHGVHARLLGRAGLAPDGVPAPAHRVQPRGHRSGARPARLDPQLGGLERRRRHRARRALLIRFQRGS